MTTPAVLKVELQGSSQAQELPAQLSAELAQSSLHPFACKRSVFLDLQSSVCPSPTTPLPALPPPTVLSSPPAAPNSSSDLSSPSHLSSPTHSPTNSGLSRLFTSQVNLNSIRAGSSLTVTVSAPCPHRFPLASPLYNAAQPSPGADVAGSSFRIRHVWLEVGRGRLDFDSTPSHGAASSTSFVSTAEGYRFSATVTRALAAAILQAHAQAQVPGQMHADVHEQAQVQPLMQSYQSYLTTAGPSVPDAQAQLRPPEWGLGLSPSHELSIRLATDRGRRRLLRRTTTATSDTTSAAIAAPAAVTAASVPQDDGGWRWSVPADASSRARENRESTHPQHTATATATTTALPAPARSPRSAVTRQTGTRVELQGLVPVSRPLLDRAAAMAAATAAAGRGHGAPGTGVGSGTRQAAGPQTGVEAGAAGDPPAGARMPDPVLISRAAAAVRRLSSLVAAQLAQTQTQIPQGRHSNEQLPPAQSAAEAGHEAATAAAAAAASAEAAVGGLGLRERSARHSEVGRPLFFAPLRVHSLTAAPFRSTSEHNSAVSSSEEPRSQPLSQSESQSQPRLQSDLRLDERVSFLSPYVPRRYDYPRTPYTGDATTYISAAVAALPWRRLTSAEAARLVEADVECCVCLGRYEEGQRAMELRCRHVLHRKCGRKWLSRRGRGRCPVCRRSVLGASDDA